MEFQDSKWIYISFTIPPRLKGRENGLYSESECSASWRRRNRGWFLPDRATRLPKFSIFENFIFTMILLWSEKTTNSECPVSIHEKNVSGFCLHIMRGKFTLRSLWFRTDLTFYHWIVMNQYWNALTRGSGLSFTEFFLGKEPLLETTFLKIKKSFNLKLQHLHWCIFHQNLNRLYLLHQWAELCDLKSATDNITLVVLDGGRS